MCVEFLSNNKEIIQKHTNIIFSLFKDIKREGEGVC
jgi:hypothetical protein